MSHTSSPLLLHQLINIGPSSSLSPVSLIPSSSLSPIPTNYVPSTIEFNLQGSTTRLTADNPPSLSLPLVSLLPAPTPMLPTTSPSTAISPLPLPHTSITSPQQPIICHVSIPPDSCIPTNNHPMQTRVKPDIFKPRLLNFIA